MNREKFKNLLYETYFNYNKKMPIKDMLEYLIMMFDDIEELKEKEKENE